MSQTSITRPGESQTDQTPRVPKNQTNFNLDHQILGTHRFGEYTPHFVAECVADDQNVKFRSAHNVRSYTLQSPLLSDLNCKKDYFAVPNEAILPMNWEKIYRNPVNGDDVPADANCIVKYNNMARFVYVWFSQFKTNFADIQAGILTLAGLKDLFYTLVAGTYVYSNGNLLSALGCHLSQYFKIYEHVEGTTSETRIKYDFDQFVDAALSSFPEQDMYLFSITINGVGVPVYNSVDREVFDTKSYPAISLREAFYLILEQPSLISSMGLNPDAPATTDSDPVAYIALSLDSPLVELAAAFIAVPETMGLATLYSEDDNLTIDFSRLLAYNIICAHYYTNDHIDYVYSAELYRQLMSTFSTSVSSGVGSVDTFSYNGVDTPYDWLSGHYINKFFYDLNMPALANIMNFNKSLKYADYFTGLKSRPLAVGDTDVAVDNNTVSVVDITRSIQRQRFLNAVNRAGAKFENYIKTLFGVKPAYDFHNPAFLAHTDDSVRGVENENTGEAQFTEQNSVSSVLRSNAEKFMFETSFDRPTIIMGITYYDIPRAYQTTVERPFFYKDRFDSFIPEMQFVGDQAAYKMELGIDLSKDPFGYETRYQEYKLKYNQAFGGFKHKLKTWAFVNGLTADDLSSNITPSFIRSSQSDLDPYYLSLTGFSLSSYFHFVVVNTNYLEMSRPMVAKPQIL